MFFLKGNAAVLLHPHHIGATFDIVIYQIATSALYYWTCFFWKYYKTIK